MSKTEKLEATGSRVRVSEHNIEGDAADIHASRVSLVKSVVEESITKIASREIQEQGETTEQAAGDEKPISKQKKKKKKYAHLLTDDPLKFANVTFDQALTAEEKAAKKAAKKAAREAKAAAKKKGGKKGDAPSAKKETPKEEERRPSYDEKTSLSGRLESQDDASRQLSTNVSKKISQVVFADAPQTKAEGEKATADSKDKRKKKGKKTKDKDASTSEGSAEKSKEKLSKKKGKKEKKEKKEKKTKSSSKTDESSEKSKKPKKKGKKKGEEDHEATEEKSEDDMTQTDEESQVSKKKKKKKDLTKSVSWVGDSKKRKLKTSGSGLGVKSTSATATKSRSGSGTLGQKLPESKYSSMMSITSDRSDLESKSAISWVASSSGKTRKARRKRSKKSSKSWTFLDDEESDEDISSGKDKKHKKGKKGKKKKGEKGKEPVTPTPKEVKEEKKEDKEEKKPSEAKVEKPEGKKGKKGKKKKGKKSAEEAPAEPEPDDVMAQIMKMKAQAAAQAAGIVEEEAPKEEKKGKTKKKKKDKKKKKKKKTDSEMFIALPPRKLSQREQIRLDLERLEMEKMQAEMDAQKKEEEERRRYQEEMRIGKEKDKRELNEQQLRVEQLSATAALIKAMIECNSNINKQEKIADEWKQYLKCDGLPDTTSPASMNTYLHLWDQVINDVNVEDIKHKTNEIIGLLEDLQDLIDESADAPEHLVNDWKWVKTLCREHQQENIDMGTYRLLRDIDSRLNRIDIPTADFNINDENFKLCLWLYVQLATPMYNPRAQVKKPLEIVFPDTGVTCVLPANLDPKCMATRLIYVKYNHLSDTCNLYNSPSIPPLINKDLYDTVADEWYGKMKYKWDHRKPPPRKVIEDAEGNQIEVTEPEPLVPEGDLPPVVPFQKLDPTPSRFELDIEADMYERARDSLYIEAEEGVVHLRKYMIIGGVYYLDLFYQPPQPHDQVAFDIRLTALQIPKRLCEVPMYIPYNQPTATDTETKKPPEELEEEMKQQEAELDKLIMVTLTLPDHVMFLDLPTVCQWDKNRRLWTTEDVHDVKHIEEKNYMTFRTGRFGAFALAVNRYINLPYQTWELKPEQDGTVTFQLTCAILMVEFNVKNNRICLTQLQNSPNNALQDIIGVYYKLSKLIRVMQNGGIDVFPACDAFCYTDGVSEKHWPTEKHLYYNMALLSPIFNFAWSRWNSQTGRRTMVLQMREYRLDKPKQKNHSMLLVTPLRATFVEATEVSPLFNETPVEGIKFYSDLYHLMKGTSSMGTRNAIQNGPLDVAKTLSDLLIETRVLSFS